MHVARERERETEQQSDTSKVPQDGIGILMPKYLACLAKARRKRNQAIA